jgi:MFS transporter, DHA2 family, multidrug resistance protein
MAERESAAPAWQPAANPWLIATAVMAATFMEVLDTSVANVSLQHIAGNLAASSDEATWVLTSYLVANAVVLPATGWLGRFFGRRRFLITCIGIFTLASALCGLANSLGMLILARILQGRRWRSTAADLSSSDARDISSRKTRNCDVRLRYGGSRRTYPWPDLWRLAYR